MIQRRASEAFALRPLVLAMLSALPLLAQGQAGVRPPVVPANALPVPAAAGWRVNGAGGAWAPITSAQKSSAVITQSSPRAIYHWQSFDIGASSSVRYQFGSADGSALNRVTGSVAPSQILGRLSSTVPGANGTAVTGGTVLLINQNGILFGPNSQVDTGALIASTLNVSDADYLSGFDSTLRSTAPTFVYEGGSELFADSTRLNFVRVDPGAVIETPSGGRVFLFAKNVDNAGTIRTPGGQTVLAAGEQVFLNDPLNERLFASEANAAIPALRGLLVEVGGAPGRVGHSGVIEVPRGNATLVGMAVNQSGRISATTSVSENGSVFLLARGATVGTDEGTVVKRATQGGELTLGAGSSVVIAPDDRRDAKGALLTADSGTTFTTSRAELSGRSITLQNDASIVAPGGIVNARAEAVPTYNTADIARGNFGPVDAAARLVMGAGATIDAAGTSSAEVSAARNFVTTELLGANDLKDAPLQRDGPLYRSRINFDLRRSVPILGDTSSYASAVQRTAAEKLAEGGTVTLAAAGAVITDPGSNIDVSGGRVTYTDAMVRPSTLVAADGNRYSANDAPADIRYRAVEGVQASQFDRWGRITPFAPVRSRLEPGYVEGRDAGTLKISAPTALIGGEIAAGALQGVRQVAGLDALATGGAVELGTRNPAGNPFGSESAAAGVLRDFTITAAPRLLAADLFDPFAPGALPVGGWIAAQTLNHSGAGTLRVTSYGNLSVEAGAPLEMPRRGSVELNAAGAQGVSLAGDITARGGSVLVQTVDTTFSDEGLQQAAGGVTLQAGRRIDVSGDWINQSLSGTGAGSAVAGGVVQLLSAHGLDLQDTSAIDVSGGATVGTGSAITGSNAGSIRIESQRGALIQAGLAPAAPVHIGADLRGASLAGGGSLRLRAAEVDIRDRPGLGLKPSIRDGDTVGSLIIDNGFFSLGGFTSFDVEGAQRLGVEANTAIAPQATRWVIAPDSRFIPTGARPADRLAAVHLPEGQRNATSIRLASSGLVGGRASGDLSLGRDASITTDAGGNVTLSAARALVVDAGARLTAPGGKATLELNRAAALGLFEFEPVFQVREGASVDVSGKTVLQPAANGLRLGRVFDGGSISLAVLGNNNAAPRDALIDVAAGAALRADGARDTLDLSTRGNAGTRISRTEVHSAGGSITIDANDGGARIAGDLSARSGGGTASDGSLALRFAETRPTTDVNPLLGEYRIDIGDAPVTAAAAGLGVAAISARTIRDGQFADVTLRTPDRIAFSDSAGLEAGRSITLQAPVISAAAGADVRISAPGSVTLGAIAASSVAAEPPMVPNSATLHLEAGLVTWTGTQELRQFDRISVDAGSRLQFDATSTANLARASGSLRTAADLSLNAPQTVVTTATDFVIDAPGRSVSFSGGDAAAAPMLSAGGSFSVNAAQIEQDGVVLAPFGRIAFNASESINLRPGSVTSVSGKDLTVPYGSLTGGTDWSYRGAPVAAPIEKAISLRAPGKSVHVEAGAKVGMAGGGELFAQEFVPGPGGSKDVFTGALDGSFAILPGINNFAPVDAETARLASAAGAAAPIVGQQITVGVGSPLPAGTYAVLPARYALLPGAFLLTPSTGTGALAPGYTLTRPDGAQLVTGRRGSTGTGYLDAQASGYIVRSSAQARQLSEVRTASADAHFFNQASFAGSAVPRLTQDAGSLQIEATRIGLAGVLDFARSATPLADRAARGGEIDIAAERIVVTDSGAAAAAAAAPDTLVLSAAQLNDTGAASVLLGGSRSAAVGGPRQLNVSAREVVIANAAEAIAVDDLILAATAQVQLEPNASIQARSSAAPSDSMATVGDGALLRASADADAGVTRTGAQRLAGMIGIGAGAKLGAAGLVVESTAGTQIAADAQLMANTLTISAPRIALGNTTSTPGVVAPGSDSLVVGPALGDILASAERLTLRSFSAIDIYGSTALGSATQRELTLDSAALAVLGEAAQVRLTAGDVRLTNTSGSTGVARGGSGQLSLHATGDNGGSGDVVLGTGAVALQGVGDARLEAVRSVRVEDSAALQVGGQLVMAAPTLIAAQSATASVSAGGLLRIEPGLAPIAGTVLPVGGAGAALTLSGARVEQAGMIDLASGRLDLIATGPAGSGGIAFEAGSSTLMAGRSTFFDSVAVTTSGGDLRASAQSGDLVIEGAVGTREAARVDVSAGGAAAHAGSLRLGASAGAVEIVGTLRGASSGGLGGTLAIDSGVPLDLAALARTLATQADAAHTNFGAGISVRNRVGDQLLAAGSTLKAHAIELSADAGGLMIAGTLDASGKVGGSVSLAARDHLALSAGARVLVNASAPGSDGGQLAAASRSGRITLGAGAAIDASGTSGGHDGHVALSAARVGAAGAAASGTEVQVDSIAAAFTGVQRIDVEALKVYDYAASVTVNSALTTTIASHNSTFIGSNGQRADTILDRLADSDAALRGQLHLRPGVELRSGADINMASDWNLTPFAANGSVSRPGGEPMNLTLRAAGNLNISASLSEGFRAGGPSAPTTGAAAARIIPEATIVAGGGAVMRLVGGADLDAASTLATLGSDTRGDVVIGRANTNVLVRSSTGDIDIAAGRDVRLLNRQAVVYSAGTPVPVADLPGWVRPQSPGSSYAVVSGSTVQSPMLDGGGSVSVQAGRDVLGATNGRTQYGSNWWWRGDSGGDTDVVSWWSRYDRFRQGFGSLGGGDVAVSAGRDARDVQLAAGSSGYIVPGRDGAAPTVAAFGAGSATLRAGRNVAGGQVFATGPRIDVHAGNDLGPGSEGSSSRLDTYLQVLHGNTTVDLDARRHAAVGRVSSAGFVPATSQFTGTQATVAFAIGGLSADASLRAVATSGAMDYRAEPPQPSDVDGVNPGGSPLRVIPAHALIAAPAGSASVGAAPTSDGIVLLPSRTAEILIASRDDLQLGSILVNGVTAAATTAGRHAFGTVNDDARIVFGNGRTPLQDDGADAVRLVSAQGDLQISGAIEVAAPLRIRAARDAVAGLLPIQMQHQTDAAVSLIEAGRDINLGNDPNSASVRVHGPGDLVVLAGRNVGFGSSQGFAAVGNRENSALPAQSATLTVVGGVADGDWREARARYFHVLGATGVGAHPGELVAQLDAVAAGLPLPSLGSAVATAFDALPAAQQVEEARLRVGDAAFDAALLTLMRRQPGGATLTQAEARTKFDAQSDPFKKVFVGSVLAAQWTGEVPANGQRELALALAERSAAAGGEPYGAALSAYIARRTGSTPANLDEAILAFDTLPPEQQLIFSNQVLVNEVRNAGRAAAVLSGEAREQAYAKAYAAIDTVFPSIGTEGELLMGVSQVKTLQGSGIVMLTPRGGINVGELASGGITKKASDLGIVTTAGGDISLIVRDDVDVNQSRVFTVGRGDLLIWAGQGNIDAGRGAKTVTGAPPPVYRIVDGKVEVDTSGSFSGSGIAVLDAGSTLDLYAPRGEINAGDAGIKSLGSAFLGALSFVGADNLAISGAAVGAPPPASTGGTSAALASTSQSPAVAATQVNPEDSEEERQRKRRNRLALILDFLGYGEVATKP